ncbi:zinc finger (C3HC4-type RING finger) family protein [Galdieria sulphuraria]|uniref:Zinc finger (C3HC4-type RING finger) family protein n=1 Tax=Galdieria sulphuraria TaxID=130081 RepID=M2Y9K1_GALSU|nr:zinc finger (C3HC4-type RING finger) family protein [Galdieria sulphuraria]EME32758.1 zinc finger (C3HC4-type RING finger) family protein [Galdieria sulphuraria]|eukprot:XP_005709278.1 zinc finger (C3HC4-type RING finger) family protein [Galdieria sulphuraria]
MTQSPPVTVIVLVFVGVIITAIVLIILFAFACRFVRDSANTSRVSNIALFGVPSSSIRRLRGLSKEEIERACPLVIYRGPHNLLVDVNEDKEEKGEGNSTLEVPRVNLPSGVFSQSFQVEDSKPFQERNIPEDAEESDFGESRKSYGYGKYRVPDGICAVCLEEVTVGTYLRMLHCRHAFHDACITHWLLCANRCPLCNCPAYERPVEATDTAQVTTDNSPDTTVAISDNQEDETRSISIADQELVASLRRQSRPTTRAARLWTFIRFGPYATASQNLAA